MGQEATSGKIRSYNLLEQIGDGAEGRVYRAQYIGPERDGLKPLQVVALKQLKDVGNREQTGAFRRGANILSRLRHPNIVRYIDFIVDHDNEFDRERHCLITELLEGKGLKELIEESLRSSPAGLPWPAARNLMSHTLSALDYAAEQGIFHRDLKPSNIFVVGNNEPKLIDFGIARFEDAGATTTATSTGFKGSFDYMAPEFGQPDKFPDFHGDAISDIYSFGVCFYQSVTGRLPLDSLSRAGGKVEFRFIKRSEGVQPSIPFDHPAFQVWANLRRCIQKCLQFDRSQRYQSFKEVLADLEKVKPRTLVHGSVVYEYSQFLGKGGFGQVIRARDNLGRDVAIKELIELREANRFVREAKVLYKTSHPNLVSYLDFIEKTDKDTSGSRRLYLVLEYLEGMPGAGLSQRIKESANGLELSEVLQIFIRYLECLEYLHREGIIHRDIKPGNLYAPKGSPEKSKIFDLGIARDTGGTYTHGGKPGTWDYMAPELVTEQDDRGSAQSDIFSLAVTLYQALTRKLPFPRLPDNNAEAWATLVQRSKHPPQYEFNEIVFQTEPRLEQVLRAALSFDPERRPKSAAAMAAQLRAIYESMEAQREYGSLIGKARVALGVGNWNEAESFAKSALNVLPNQAEAAELQQKAAAGRRRQQVDGYLLEAGNLLATGDLDGAEASVRNGLAIAPGDLQLEQLRKDTAAKRAEQLAIRERSHVSPANNPGVSTDDLDGKTEPFEEPETRDTISNDDELPGSRPTAATVAAPISIREPQPPAVPEPAPVVPEIATPKDAGNSGRKGKVLVAVGLGVAVVTVAAWLARDRNSSPNPGGPTIPVLGTNPAYETALKAGLAALAVKDWAKAIEQAEAALAVQPGDPTATELKQQATAGKAAADAAQTAAKAADARYSTALQNGRTALAAKEWVKALEQADVALAVRPGDATATELKRQVTEGKAAADAAQTAAKAAETKYGTAMQSGRTALATKDWAKAIEQAEVALAVRPGDATATELKRQATEGKASALAQGEADQQYEAAVKAAGTALDNKNWTEAERQADLALSLRTRDAAAESLRQRARAGLSAGASPVGATVSDVERQKLFTTLKLLKAWTTGSNEEKVIDPNTKKEAKMLGAPPKATIDKLMNALKTLEGQLTKAQLLTPEIQDELSEIKRRLGNGLQ